MGRRPSVSKTFFVLAFIFILWSPLSSANLFWPPPPAEPRIFFVKNISDRKDMGIKESVWGHLRNFFFGGKYDALSRPMAVAVGEDGTMYIADAGIAAIFIYQPKEKNLKRIEQIDKKIDLVSPVGIAVSKGLIFVADSYLKKVFAITAQGTSRFALGEEQGIGRPTGLYSYEDRLYIVDTQGCQIFVFDSRGRLIFKFGKKGAAEGEFNLPTNIFVDRQKRIYVSDTLNSRVQVFDSTGKFLKAIGSAGDSSGFFSRPKGAAVDSLGHIYITDAMFDNIQIFDDQKNFLLGFGKAGHDEGEFWLPAGITIDQDDNIYVADSYNQRISIFHYGPENQTSR